MSASETQPTFKKGDQVKFVITRSNGRSYSFSVRYGEVTAILFGQLEIKYRGRTYWAPADECYASGQPSALDKSIARKVVNRE